MAASDCDGADLTLDDFLGGRLRVLQPRRGYRAGVDPVLLAASVPATAGQTVLDLGCGTGVAALCLGRRVPGLMLTGLELQPAYAALARHSAARNQIPFDVITGDLAEMPQTLRLRQFDHVIANPPYFDRAAGSPGPVAGRETAMGEKTPLAQWVRQAARRCAPGGQVAFIQRADRLPELLAHATRHLGSITVRPIIPRAGRPARLIILHARKGGRAGFRLLDSWVMHDGATHSRDREDYTAATAGILRHADPLPMAQ